jgi:hypothetical protein
MKTLVSKDGYPSVTAQAILQIRPIRVWMSKFFFFAITALVRCCLCASHAEPIQVPMSPGHFDTGTSMARFSAAAPQFGEFLGSSAIYLPSGLITVKGANFRDGIVDVDVASKPGSLFIGVAFRIESEANLEMIYLRPGVSDTTEAVQYTPRLNGDAIWQLLNTNHEKASAHIPGNQWIHMKLVVEGRTCTLFLNESNVPTLTVTNLRRGDSEGGIGLWGLGGGGYFSNLRYEPLPDRKPLPDLAPFQRAGLLSDWELSPAFDASDVDAGAYPTSISKWEKVYAEDPGFVLVNRYRTSPAMFPMPSREEMQKGRAKGAKVVFARTQVSSVNGGEKILKIGYSDDIVIYLNGKQIFSGKNALSYRTDDSLGTFGLNDETHIHLNPGNNELLVAVTEYNGGWAFECELSESDPNHALENGSFTLPLEAGDNEVAVAMGNNFSGWGLKLRVTDPEGVHLAAK